VGRWSASSSSDRRHRTTVRRTRIQEFEHWGAYFFYLFPPLFSSSSSFLLHPRWIRPCPWSVDD
jgi:hypothetical protein